jgi:hypothetical protein
LLLQAQHVSSLQVKPKKEMLIDSTGLGDLFSAFVMASWHLPRWALSETSEENTASEPFFAFSLAFLA